MAVKHKNKSAKFFIAAIGASAGGLEALQKLISGIPKNVENLAIIVAQHLGTESMLPELLASKTDFYVTEIENEMLVQPRVVYVAPPNQEIVFKKGKLYLKKTPSVAGPTPSLNLLFSSLAKSHQNRLIGMILSGTGADGANGMKEITMSGGTTLVQDPDTAKFRSMPEAAIKATLIDWILPPEELGKKLAHIISDPKKLVDSKAIGDEAFYDIIQLLEQVTGTDFGNYKHETLFRRIEKRQSELKLSSLKEYYNYLKNHSEEADLLFRKVLIGVTGFFRDPAVFDSLEQYVESLIEGKSHGESLRVWVPGCATGEEAYSVAMIIDTRLRKKKLNMPVQIFATDINDSSLIVARKGVYDKKSIEKAPAQYVTKYFKRLNGDMYEISKTIRSMILFSHHDLSHHPPFLRLDLIVCRNLLIYFNKRLQEQIFRLFYSALNSNGYLVLGKSESIGKFSDLFATVQADVKIYHRVPGKTIRTLRYGKLPLQLLPKPRKDITIPEMVKETLYNIFKHPYVVVNDGLDIQEISGDVSLYIGLKPGQMNANVIKLAHKDLRIELKSLALNCTKEKREVQSQVRKFSSHGYDHYVKFIMRPLLYQATTDQFYMIVFEAVKGSEGKVRKKPAKKEQSRIRELEEELENTRADLQDFIERLEESNTQLQSLNEEMQSSNEELRISNEELETANEELQSSNEEMVTTYQELKTAHETLTKQEQLLRASRANIQALINNSMQAFILLDKNYHVIAFNEMAKTVMKMFFQVNLKKGEGLNEPEYDHDEIFTNGFRESLTRKAIQREYELKDHKGALHTFNFSFTPVLDEQGKIESVSVGILDITDWKKAKQEIGKLSLVARYTNNGVMITDEKGRIQWVNEGFHRLTGLSFEQVVNKLPGRLIPKGELRSDAIKKIEIALKKKQAVTEVLLKYTRNEKLVWVSLEMTPIFDHERLTHFIGILTDITGIIRAEELRKREETLEQRQYLVDAIASNFPEGIVGLIDSDFKYIYVGGGELKRLGQQRNDVLGTGLLDHISADAHIQLKPQLKKVFEGESIYIDVPAGEEVYGLHVVPVVEEKKIPWALVVLQNITQRKKAEAETLRALKQQKELSDMKSRFVSLASHEFRTPLSTMLSSVYLVEQFQGQNDKVNAQKHLQRIKSNIKNLTEILTEFLSLSKIEEGKVRNRPVELNVKDFCTELVEGLITREGQKIIYKHKGSTEYIYVDKGHLTNILNNLLSNAVKYSPAGKKISLTSECTGGGFTFSVRDKGMGIPVDDQSQLFNTFFRAKNVSNIQGTGLGLHLVKKYLDIVGGTIDFVSTPGKGSTFKVTIPQVHEVVK